LLNIDYFPDSISNIKLFNVFFHLFVAYGLKVKQISDEKLEQFATAVLDEPFLGELLDCF